MRPIVFPPQLRAASLVAMLAVPSAACADVWGYVDGQGRPHVATRKLDERYQLFFRGRTSADAPSAAEAATREADDAFARSPLFQRVERHPNVKRFEPLLARYAKEHGLDFALVKAVVAVESAYDPDAVSAKGAVGLMQVVPETAERYGVTGDAQQTLAQKLRNPATNVSVGTRYLRDLLALFANDLPLALAAYNAGEATVQRFAYRVPPFPETQEFVRLVDRFYALYRPPPPPAQAATRITVPRRAAAAP